MKIALMILFVFGGFVMTSGSAQSCTPCPPKCCASACKPDTKGSVSLNTTQTDVAAFAAFSPEAMTTGCQDAKLTNEQVKDGQPLCQPAACKPAAQTASFSGSEVASKGGCSSVAVNSKPTPACKPGKG